MNYIQQHESIIRALSQFKQELNDDLLNEAYQQWSNRPKEVPRELTVEEHLEKIHQKIYSSIYGGSDKSAVTNFADFHREFCDENYYECVKLTADKMKSDPTLPEDFPEIITCLSELEETLYGKKGDFTEWAKISYELCESREEQPLATAKDIRDTLDRISSEYGSITARDLYNSKHAVLTEEMVNAAEYLKLGGQLEHIRPLCDAGFFMPCEYERFNNTDKAQAVNFMSNGGNPKNVYESIKSANQQSSGCDNQFALKHEICHNTGLDTVDVTIQASLDEDWQVDERVEALKEYLKNRGFSPMLDEPFVKTSEPDNYYSVTLRYNTHQQIEQFENLCDNFPLFPDLETTEEQEAGQENQGFSGQSM